MNVVENRIAALNAKHNLSLRAVTRRDGESFEVRLCTTPESEQTLFGPARGDRVMLFLDGYERGLAFSPKGHAALDGLAHWAQLKRIYEHYTNKAEKAEKAEKSYRAVMPVSYSPRTEPMDEAQKTLCDAYEIAVVDRDRAQAQLQAGLAGLTKLAEDYERSCPLIEVEGPSADRPSRIPTIRTPPTMKRAEWNITTQKNPCPVCGRFGWCAVNDTGGVQCRHDLASPGAVVRKDSQGTPYAFYGSGSNDGVATGISEKWWMDRWRAGGRVLERAIDWNKTRDAIKAATADAYADRVITDEERNVLADLRVKEEAAEREFWNALHAFAAI